MTFTTPARTHPNNWSSGEWHPAHKLGPDRLPVGCLGCMLRAAAGSFCVFHGFVYRCFVEVFTPLRACAYNVYGTYGHKSAP